MDLLSKTFERVTYTWHEDDNGDKVFAFRIASAKIDDEISYYIHRASRPNESHMIERSKKLGHGFSDIRYKLYDDDKSFENAIKRIEKMAKKSLV